MDPGDLKKSLRYDARCMFIEAPVEGSSTCRSKGPDGEVIERTYYQVIASQKPARVTQEHGSGRRLRTRSALGGFFLMERDEKIQELRELKRPKASPGYSSEKLPARNKAEGGTEGKEEEEDVRKMENEVMNAILTSGRVESTARDVLLLL